MTSDSHYRPLPSIPPIQPKDFDETPIGAHRPYIYSNTVRPVAIKRVTLYKSFHNVIIYLLRPSEASFQN